MLGACVWVFTERKEKKRKIKEKRKEVKREEKREGGEERKNKNIELSFLYK